MPLPINGEDELLPIILHTGNISAIPPAAIKFTIPGFLRVYESPDRSGMIKSGVAIHMTHDGDYMFYVEGVGPGSGTINLSGQISDNPTVAFKPIESLKISAFDWTGTLNAPQFGTYRYKVSNAPSVDPVKNPQGGLWLTPANGTMALHGTGGRPGADKSDIDITWGAGPVVNSAIYQASPDFIWGLGVNVVKVTVTNPTNGDPAFKAGTPVDGPVTGNPAHPDKQVKIVVSGAPGLQWNAVVQFSGPNGNHGVDLMKTGFVQNLKFTAYNGTYGGPGFVRSASKIIGNTYWDTIDRTAPGEVGDYTDKRYSTNHFAVFDDASSAPGGAVAHEISSRDTPQSGPPAYYFPGRRSLTSMSLIWDFTIYLTATTKEKLFAADSLYVPQAMAAWSFNGSGTIGAALKWTGTPGVVTAPTAWAAPSGKPITAKPRVNDILENYWTQTGF